MRGLFVFKNVGENLTPHFAASQSFAYRTPNDVVAYIYKHPVTIGFVGVDDNGQGFRLTVKGR